MQDAHLPRSEVLISHRPRHQRKGNLSRLPVTQPEEHRLGRVKLLEEKGKGQEKSVSLQEEICKLQDSHTRSSPEVMPLSHGTNRILSPLLNRDKGQNITVGDPFTVACICSVLSCYHSHIDTIHCRGFFALIPKKENSSRKLHSMANKSECSV